MHVCCHNDVFVVIYICATAQIHPSRYAIWQSSTSNELPVIRDKYPCNTSVYCACSSTLKTTICAKRLRWITRSRQIVEASETRHWPQIKCRYLNSYCVPLLPTRREYLFAQLNGSKTQSLCITRRISTVWYRNVLTHHPTHNWIIHCSNVGKWRAWR